MFSNILLNKDNLLYNARKTKEICGHKICAMIKANGYGHGSKEIASVLDCEVDYFGVSNQYEGEEIKNIVSRPVLVMGACDDYERCIREGLSFILISFQQAQEMIKLGIKIGIKPKMHLCINSGMNRYGINNTSEFKKTIDLLDSHNCPLEGLYTHFSSLTTDKVYTQRQKDLFNKFGNFLPKNWQTIKHIGGGGTIFTDIEADMNRVGLYLVGYGNEMFKPVLSLQTKIVDIVEAKAGEHIGYLCGYTAPRDMRVATLPLGYGDGLPRKLSNKLQVEINGKKALNVGNICMDAFMVDVSNIDCKIGDSVTVLKNASQLAKILDTTEYEVLTNLTKFRGERKII